MGLFDFLKTKAPPPPSSEEDKPANAPKGKQPQGDKTGVPEGHEVTFHHAMAEPSVIRTQGGVVLVDFGVAGDDPDRELGVILRGLGALLEKESPPAHLVNSNRDIRLHELFAPAKPELLQFRSPVSWVFNQGSVESLCAGPRRLQAVLRCMYEISRRGGSPSPQAAYLVDASPAIRPFARLVRGLGLIVKQPDDQESGPLLMAEIKRPDGPILCLMAGKPHPADDIADDYALAMNAEKARAADAGHDGVLLRLQEQELSGLVERVGSAEGEPQVPLRAPRLRQVILDLQEEADHQAGMKAILGELLSRSESLFFMKNPHDEGMEVRTYGAAGRALPMFSDLRCLRWAAEDLGRDPGSFRMATIHPRKLIAMAAGGSMGIAICTYRDREMPVYVILPGPLVKSVAEALVRR